MKKTLLAAALALGFAGVAQAETSVTLYGVLDGGVGYQKFDSDREGISDSKRTGLINGIQSGNRWGVRGTEDLGNGLQAVFQLESGFGLDTGNSAQGGRLFGRHATLGLRSDAWGQLDFGRQTNIASKYMGAIDPFGLGFNQANMGAAFTAANTARFDNMIMYQTPNFSGFQFGVGYSFNANGSQEWDDDDADFDTDDLNRKAWTTGLRYANGPLAVALTYDRMEAPIIDYAGPAALLPDGTIDRDVAGVDTEDIQSYNLGLAYDFEVVKLHLAAGQTKDGIFAGQTIAGRSGSTYSAVEGLKVNSYMVGLSAPLGAGKVMASWTMADPTDVPDAWEAAGRDEKQNTYSIGYTYNLSKRTNVYAIGSYAQNVNFYDDDKGTLIGLGLRHQF